MKSTATSIKSTSAILNIALMFVLFLLFSAKASAQSLEQNEVSTKTLLSSCVEYKVATLDTQIDFVGWFMGTNQNQSINEFVETPTRAASTKKQILSSGIVPNRVLYKTLVKKVFVDAVV